MSSNETTDADMSTELESEESPVEKVSEETPGYDNIGDILESTKKKALGILGRAAEALKPIVEDAAESLGPEVKQYLGKYVKDLTPILLQGGKKAGKKVVKEGIQLGSNPQAYAQRKIDALETGIDATVKQTEATLEHIAQTVKDRVEQEKAAAKATGVIPYTLTRLLQGADKLTKAAAVAGDVGKNLLGEVVAAKVARPSELTIDGIDVLIGQYTDEAKRPVISVNKAATISTFVIGLSQDSEFNAAFNDTDVDIGYNILRLYTGLATVRASEVLDFIQKGGTLPGKIEASPMLESVKTSLEQYSEMLSRKESEFLRRGRR